MRISPPNRRPSLLCVTKVAHTNFSPGRLRAGTMNRDSIATFGTASEQGVKEQLNVPGHFGEIVIAPEVLEEWNNMSIEQRARFERRLLWKLDLRLVPWLSLLYLLSFLDRTNIGNAKLQGVSSFTSFVD